MELLNKKEKSLLFSSRELYLKYTKSAASQAAAVFTTNFTLYLQISINKLCNQRQKQWPWTLPRILNFVYRFIKKKKLSNSATVNKQNNVPFFPSSFCFNFSSFFLFFFFFLAWLMKAFFSCFERLLLLRNNR